MTKFTITEEELNLQIEVAKEKGAKESLKGPHIETIHYDSFAHSFVLVLQNKTNIVFSPDLISEFKGASVEQLADIWYSNGCSKTVHWDKLNFDIHTKDLINLIIEVK